MEQEQGSRIAQSMVVRGVVECRGRLVLEGVLEGRVSGGILQITETGRLSGEVHNQEVECAGQLQGDIVTEAFILRPTGCHTGTAETRRLTVDPGAVLDCVLQSGMTAPGAAGKDRQRGGPGLELAQVLTAFREGSRPCCLDIPWSVRLELYNQLLNLLQQGTPLIMVTGEPGSGKSVLAEKLRDNPPAGCQFLVVEGRTPSVDGLLRELAAELGLAGADDLAHTELLTTIKPVLVDRRSSGRRVVLLVDEAEALAPTVLEEAVRCLTGALDGGEALLQLVLFGTPKMETRLAASLVDYFAGETGCQLRLAPLGLKDTADYLRFCLQLAAAGHGSASLAFLPYETIRTIHVLSRGKLAEINRLADQAMQKAHAAGAQAIYPDFL